MMQCCILRSGPPKTVVLNLFVVTDPSKNLLKAMGHFPRNIHIETSFHALYRMYFIY